MTRFAPMLFLLLRPPRADRAVAEAAMRRTGGSAAQGHAVRHRSLHARRRRRPCLGHRLGNRGPLATAPPNSTRHRRLQPRRRPEPQTPDWHFIASRPTYPTASRRPSRSPRRWSSASRQRHGGEPARKGAREVGGGGPRLAVQRRRSWTAGGRAAAAQRRVRKADGRRSGRARSSHRGRRAEHDLPFHRVVALVELGSLKRRRRRRARSRRRPGSR